ncbi:MAG: hypothetical protein IE933_11395 [Sphingomonadales bacterium]|nr:hypothetical protein [Sphingomonadales bacterium]MBD3774891.1 hypothetical protein [Paracoccaceae bacterium]
MTVHTPNLPTLIADLPGDRTRAPQTEFVRERQVEFLENLSITGSVRSAASAAGVSHQTAYRARRGCREFRLAWNAALLAARVQAEDVLACRALDGVEEEVFYHGEVIATRRRFDSRLLLAHLARLDRLVGDPATNAFAEDFDAALDRFARGEAQPEPEAAQVDEAEADEAEAARGVGASPPLRVRRAQDDRGLGDHAGGHAGGGEISPPGQCNTRSMSPDQRPARPQAEPCPECGGACDDPRAVLGPRDCQWLGHRLDRMEAARPYGAPSLQSLGDPGAVEAAQLLAFEDGAAEWWLLTA